MEAIALPFLDRLPGRQRPARVRGIRQAAFAIEMLATASAP